MKDFIELIGLLVVLVICLGLLAYFSFNFFACLFFLISLFCGVSEWSWWWAKWLTIAFLVVAAIKVFFFDK